MTATCPDCPATCPDCRLYGPCPAHDIPSEADRWREDAMRLASQLRGMMEEIDLLLNAHPELAFCTDGPAAMLAAHDAMVVSDD